MVLAQTLVNVRIQLNCRIPSLCQRTGQCGTKPTHLVSEMKCVSVTFHFRLSKLLKGNIWASTIFWFKNFPFFLAYDPSNSDSHRSSLQMPSKLLFFSYFIQLYSSSQWINCFVMSYLERTKSGSVQCLCIEHTAKSHLPRRTKARKFFIKCLKTLRIYMMIRKYLTGKV